MTVVETAIADSITVALGNIFLVSRVIYMRSNNEQNRQVVNLRQCQVSGNMYFAANEYQNSKDLPESVSHTATAAGQIDQNYKNTHITTPHMHCKLRNREHDL